MQVFHGLSRSVPGRCALTIGNFDGVHRGHLALLAHLRERAQARGLPVTVLTFEPHPREFFQPASAPARLTNLREKLNLLAAAGVERAFVCRFNRQFAMLDAEAFIREVLVASLGVRYLLIGDDFCFGRGRQGGFSLLRAMSGPCGFELEAMPTIEVDGARASSSAIRDALAAGDLDTAARLLGRPFAIAGRVTVGNRIGRTLGFPTANIALKRRRPPLAGIYAVRVHGGGLSAHPGAASLGVRPTIGDGLMPVLEVNLLDFDGDLYRAHLSVEFCAKLRDEEKYADLDALKRQIAADVEAVRRYFTANSAVPR
ncbi:MAG TPA: bifunctional riboflavin kinase/FAD synthetase [Rhodocyclaceae bacterium]|nr:bifunctional riboflavin kinase/FAD synthetase [Rhodocyclaceae bacterium]